MWRLCADRVFGILRENNPELTGEKRRTIMKPPQARIEKTALLEGCARLSAGSWSVRRPFCRLSRLRWAAIFKPRMRTLTPGTARPQVAREGTKKTVFTNFMELCKAMNRQLEHVQLFLLAELGTSGNLDGQSRLIVKGRFLPKAFEGVLRRYVNECGPHTPRALDINAFDVQQSRVCSMWLRCCAESLEPRLCDLTACSSTPAPVQSSPGG